MKERAE
jgi:serine/threonine kinase 38